MKPASICKKHSSARKTDSKPTAVILSAAIASLREAFAESKDPYKRNHADVGASVLARAGFVALQRERGSTNIGKYAAPEK